MRKGYSGVDILEVVRETERAILALVKTSTGDDTFWIPKRLMADSDGLTTIPKWYIKKIGM